MQNMGAVDKLSPEDLHPIRDLVAEKAGISFEEKKYYFLERRVLKRMQETDCTSAQDYYRILKLSSSKDEFQNLLNLLTTNETYFYRNISQLESFAEEALPLILEEKKAKGDSKIRIWSAACSSGDEPYTLAILLKEHLQDFSRWDIKIVATDIDENILAKASAGIYDKRAVKDVPPKILSKYFTAEGNSYHVNPDIRNMVSFEKLNLMDRIAIRSFMGQDFVFCRNVLIYFHDEGRRQVVNSIYDALNKGGFIFLGHSESVGKYSAAFQLVKFNKSLSYRK